MRRRYGRTINKRYSDGFCYWSLLPVPFGAIGNLDATIHDPLPRGCSGIHPCVYLCAAFLLGCWRAVGKQSGRSYQTWQFQAKRPGRSTRLQSGTAGYRNRCCPSYCSGARSSRCGWLGRFAYPKRAGSLRHLGACYRFAPPSYWRLSVRWLLQARAWHSVCRNGHPILLAFMPHALGARI